MPFCPECGKSVGSSQKFCRSCGASLIEELPAPAAPSAPAAVAPVCRSCGTPLAPDEKFCGICGAKAEGAPLPAPAVPVSVPVYHTPSPAPAPRFPTPAPLPPASPGFSPPPPPPPQQYAVPAPAAPAADARLCKACGNPIRPGDMFCSKCLVRVPEIPAAAPVMSPAWESPVPAGPGGYVCASCGSPTSGLEKYCGICGAVVVGARAPVPAPAPRTVPPAPPAPVPAYVPPPPPEYAVPPPVLAAAVPGSGAQACKACGNPIRPGDRFCSKCLVKVPDIPAAAPAVLPARESPVPAGPGGYVCASCGSPIAGSEKYCGICGAVAAAAPAPAPVPAAPPAAKFCGSCGAPVNKVSPGDGLAPSRPAPAAPGGEEVIGVIANARKVKFLGATWDTWNIVITPRRMIMVQMTSAMVTAAVAEAQARAKAEGKGFFGIMKDQLSASFRYAIRYETMNPDMALAETPGNLSVENARITAIRLKLKDTGSGDAEYTEFRMVVESADGKFEYLMAEDDRYVNLLKQVYGDKVHMPFGYLKLGGARIKFF